MALQNTSLPSKVLIGTNFNSIQHAEVTFTSYRLMANTSANVFAVAFAELSTVAFAVTEL